MFNRQKKINENQSRSYRIEPQLLLNDCGKQQRAREDGVLGSNEQQEGEGETRGRPKIHYFHPPN